MYLQLETASFCGCLACMLYLCMLGTWRNHTIICLDSLTIQNQSSFGYDAIYVGLDTATVTCEIPTACLSDSDVEHIVYSKVCFKYNVLIFFLRVWKALRVPHQLLALTLWKLLVSVHLVSFSFMNVLLYSHIPLLNSSNFWCYRSVTFGLDEFGTLDSWDIHSYFLCLSEVLFSISVGSCNTWSNASILGLFPWWRREEDRSATSPTSQISNVFNIWWWWKLHGTFLTSKWQYSN